MLLPQDRKEAEATNVVSERWFESKREAEGTTTTSDGAPSLE